MNLFNKNNNKNDNEFNEGQVIDVSYVEQESGSKENTSYKKNLNRKGRNKLLSYIAIGLTCASLGGVVGSTATINYFNEKYVVAQTNTSQKNTSQKNTSDNEFTQVSQNKTPLSASEIVKKVGPAIVGISTKTNVNMRTGLGSRSSKYSQVQEGLGSGVIFNEDGYIITNYHVIEGAQQISVILNTENGAKEVAATVVNYDANRDIAVVKLDEKVELPGIAKLGDSNSIEVGESVVAIGSPVAKEFLGSVTSGIISALNRQISDDNKNVEKFIQTDAAINPGNSGGALVNKYGEVIGINTAKLDGDEIEGMGFSIPINEVKSRLESLMKPSTKSNNEKNNNLMQYRSSGNMPMTDGRHMNSF